ncbi:50S ribosomal protein L3 N(5)-glutamine methyltransferase [Magnetococcales bacterium HHB-1]
MSRHRSFLSRSAHKKRRRDPRAFKRRSVQAWIDSVAMQLLKAPLNFANGLQSAEEEARYLVYHALTVDSTLSFHQDKRFVERNEAKSIKKMLFLRIQKRLPLPYITQEGFFAGKIFYIDERVLIPRSRIENFFDDEEGIEGLLMNPHPKKILDLCTGSGCLAITLSLHFQKAVVDGVDLCEKALAVAEINRKRFSLAKTRMRFYRSNLFSAIKKEPRYDLIVTNPPYVPTSEYNALPKEFLNEPKHALEAGPDGLDLIIPILQQAASFLTENGMLICEVGDTVEEIMLKRWPDFPGLWPLFHFGGRGVFVISKAQLNDIKSMI